jgi:hypothetical protein
VIPTYLALAERIRLDPDEIERTLDAIQRHWQRLHAAAQDQDAYLNSVALNLHGFYSGLERLFEMTALQVDGSTLAGDSWHAELLQQMRLDIPEVRPPVLREDTASRLDEYRKFRHRIRNIYATKLDPERIEPLVSALPDLWPNLRGEMLSFAAFLERIAGADP